MHSVPHTCADEALPALTGSRPPAAPPLPVLGDDPDPMPRSCLHSWARLHHKGTAEAPHPTACTSTIAPLRSSGVPMRVSMGTQEQGPS